MEIIDSYDSMNGQVNDWIIASIKAEGYNANTLA